jgi:hypothetical protein
VHTTSGDLVKRGVVVPRRAATILAIILFALCQLLLWEEGWAGGLCVRSLSNASEGAHAFYTWTKVGWPVQYVSVARQGCFEDRSTTVDWQLGGLLVDAFVFVGLGAVLFWLTLQWQRFRHRGAD